MLTENHIIDIVTAYYMNLGYLQIQKKYTSDKGIDLILKKENILVYVEAKGETSSKESSSNFGNPFSSSQVKTHVAMALYQIFSSINSSPENVMFVLAFPNNQFHKKYY